ncbi:uncharacterized protein LOC144762492 [Lissotriton helveticus]
MEEHIGHVRAVLDRLQKNSLYAKLVKCLFHVPKIESLGYVINEKGLRMDNKKVRAITEWKSTMTVKGLQSFLEFANFYRRFIKDFSRLVQPINRFLKKGEWLLWEAEAESTFQELKARFT